MKTEKMYIDDQDEGRVQRGEAQVKYSPNKRVPAWPDMVERVLYR